ncbi:uncharacterized protein METZ01_LOCUS241511 [marine metagenome]|uniref:Uncharacterized protein n=1 Tax=marine metagenome TaxID=408172 RepID=A0A382HNY7_9ZZZZ
MRKTATLLRMKSMVAFHTLFYPEFLVHSWNL